MPPKPLAGLQTLGLCPSLVPLLQDKVKAVREEAAGALAAIGTASIPSLVQALSHRRVACPVTCRRSAWQAQIRRGSGTAPVCVI